MCNAGPAHEGWSRGGWADLDLNHPQVVAPGAAIVQKPGDPDHKVQEQNQQPGTPQTAADCRSWRADQQSLSSAEGRHAATMLDRDAAIAIESSSRIGDGVGSDHVRPGSGGLSGCAERRISNDGWRADRSARTSTGLQ